MNKKLVAYFSAGGRTAKAAAYLAEKIGADLFEIEPEEKYTKADLNWMNKNSRSSLEMKDQNARPALKSAGSEMSEYDTIFLGFPIWWYTAPRIIAAFLEAHDFSGKRIVLFATSGSSGFGKTAEDLQASAPGASIAQSIVLSGVLSAAKLEKLADLCK